MWKPAVPVVMVVALLCAVPASFTPELIGFADDTPAVKAHAVGQNKMQIAPSSILAGNITSDGPKVHMVPASLKTNDRPIVPIRKAKAVLASHGNIGQSQRNKRGTTTQPLVMAQNQSSMPEQYVTVREDVFFIVTERTASGEQQSWQVHMVQVSMQPQSKIVQKPRKI